MSRYRIQAVSKLVGVPSATLRAWERRYGVPSPARTSSAYRLYSDADVQLIRRMREMVESGLAPAEASRLALAEDPEATAVGPEPTEPLRHVSLTPSPSVSLPQPRKREPVPDVRVTPQTSSLMQISQSVGQPADFLVDPAEGEDRSFHSARERILAGVRTLDLDVIDRELRNASGLDAAHVVYQRVLAPVLATVGYEWHEGKLTIAQEHLASNAIASLLLQMLRLVQPASTNRRAVLACFAEEQHQITLYGVGLHLAAWGFRTVLLGARTPPSAIARVVESLSPSLVALSASIAPTSAESRELVDAYADACRDTPWVVGGIAASGLAPFVEQRGGLVITGPIHAARDRVEAYLAARSN
jgi:DNA-binding transcriptional MerR regulator/methanogenic corrinoid protein MtbC1